MRFAAFVHQGPVARLLAETVRGDTWHGYRNPPCAIPPLTTRRFYNWAVAAWVAVAPHTSATGGRWDAGHDLAHLAVGAGADRGLICTFRGDAPQKGQTMGPDEWPMVHHQRTARRRAALLAVARTRVTIGETASARRQSPGTDRSGRTSSLQAR